MRLPSMLLTAAATVLGVLLATGFDFDWRPDLPLTFSKGKSGRFVIGAESAAFWGPLGVAIIFGLTIATFLTLVIVPTFYALLESWTQKIAAVARRVFAAKTEAEVAMERTQ